ncbi:MAG: VanW family protein [Candidatus Moraniibacteriota bacterium]
MYRDNRRNRERLLAGAAIFAALVFLFPFFAKARVLPEKIVFQTDDFAEIVPREELINWFTWLSALSFKKEMRPEIENSTLCPLPRIVCVAFISRDRRNHLIFEQTLIMNDATVQTYMNDLGAKISRDPKNARLGLNENKVVVTEEAVPGRTLEIEATLDRLREKLDQNESAVLTVSLVTKELTPKISSSTINSLGIKDLIGEGKTDFRGSPKNRIFNINRALQQFDGIIIPTGGEFSFVEYLSEVDGEHGYLPELVIKNNRTEPEFGGGICQVSTTVFRAALNAGLKITARKNHAYPVRYYKPYGMDATIYIPKPDLRFQNNTPGPILVFPQITGTELKFLFFGTPDGRSVTIDGPHILESNPDGSMRTLFTQIVKDSSGQNIIEDKFPSNYKSPSLFPHPGEEPVYTSKPDDWSEKQWKDYKKFHP